MNGKTKFIYEQYCHDRIRKSKDDEISGEKPNETFVTASAALQRGDRVLDIGCGDGSFSLYISIIDYDIIGHNRT